MALILSIETATQVCSVALHSQGKLLGCQELHLEKSHATHLAVMIEQLLTNCQLTPKDLSAVAVSKGPGSYTGLRIGVATAKGLCYGLEIPLIAVNTLSAMACQFKSQLARVDYFCPMLDARRMEVYCMLLNQQYEVVLETHALVVDEGSFEQWRSLGKVLFFGDGSDKCREILKGTNSIFVAGVKPSAKTIGVLAWDKYLDQQLEDLAYFEPFYLKEFRTTIPKNKSGIPNGAK